ncbi:MFS transporter [Pedobacter cryoconitis]|uniref:Putative MFS family arabinose efflux permease n=1 Tax=Pedobacter cryoconitis TaxID=188932 RepID=A0A7X0MK25_9SPHI|nr:MFS transporter [Pedobacter cryoconitis]MBB6500043.1 putative MFS family arabinose efflux permease [Pedobacter cryoconitis]
MLKKIYTTYKNSFSGLSKQTWLLSTVMLINRSSSMAVPFMSLYMTQYLHRPPSDAGLIITLFGAGSIAGATAGGKLTDVIGFRAVQIIAAITGGVFFILYSTITHFHSLCLLTLVISFFSEAFRPANFAAIATYAKEGTLTRSYSLNRLATNMGFAVGSAIGGIVASFSYPLLFVVDGSVSVLSGVAILILLPATVKGARKAVAEKIKGMNVQKPWEDILFVKFLLLTTMMTTCFYLMFRVVPLFYKEVWHINEMEIGLILGTNGLIIALFEMVMINKIENKRSPIHYIVKGVLFIGLAYLMLLVPGITPVLVAILSVILFTIGEMFALPFINTFVMKRSNEFNRGQYAAGYTLSWSVSQVIGPSAGFFLAERYGYNWLWVMLIVLLLLCASGFKMLRDKMN